MKQIKYRPADPANVESENETYICVERMLQVVWISWLRTLYQDWYA